MARRTVLRLLISALTALAVAAVPLLPAQAGGRTAEKPRTGTSALPCPAWPMYGAGLARRFATDCDSPIDRKSVFRLAPAWTVKTPRTVTASPVVAGGTVYVGAWDGVMYAIDLRSGETVWTYETASAPGAAFGPIVSSAAVADAVVAGKRRRLVVFGSGPVLYALDAATGSLAWRADFSRGVPATPVEIESSPAVWHGTVYVGMDTHGHPSSDTGGVTGGLLAVDLATGELRWKFEPDPGGHGCGGVWGSTVVDVERAQVVFGTANCASREHP